MALFSSFTTSAPSTPLTLNRLVQVIRMPCKGEQMGLDTEGWEAPQNPQALGETARDSDKAEAQRTKWLAPNTG